jgi:hypothetical protein
MQFLQIISVAWLALVCTISTAFAEKRVAVVIGNERYPNLSANEQLQKAVNDARAVGDALRRIGFDVISGENLGRQALLGRLDDAAQRLSAGDTVFFFFSGHGVTVDGFNYILPVDVPAVGAGQVVSLTGAAIKEEDITAAFVRAGARVAVVVLDACRNNPFGAGTKGIGSEKGLAPHEPPSGVFTFYAASRGEAALDRLYDGDPNPNSVFTRVLLPGLARPDLDLPALAREVREEVTRLARSVNHAQRPAYYDETSGDKIFLAAIGAATGAQSFPAERPALPADRPGIVDRPGTRVPDIVIDARTFIKEDPCQIAATTDPGNPNIEWGVGIANGDGCRGLWTWDRPNHARYSVVAKKSGIYQLSILYAAGDKREVGVAVNNSAPVLALSETTGGFCLDVRPPRCRESNVKWWTVGTFQLHEGTNDLTIDRSSGFPHIKAIQFSYFRP